MELHSDSSPFSQMWLLQMFPPVSLPALPLLAELLQQSLDLQLSLRSRHAKSCMNTHKGINLVLRRLDPKASTQGMRDSQVPVKDLGYNSSTKKRS